PELLTGFGIERVNNAIERGDEYHPVNDRRGCNALVPVIRNPGVGLAKGNTPAGRSVRGLRGVQRISDIEDEEEITRDSRGSHLRYARSRLPQFLAVQRIDRANGAVDRPEIGDA